MRGMVHALGGLVTLGGKQELFQRATVVKVLLTRAIGSMQALRLSRSRRETMAAHDVRHLCSIRRTAGRRVDHLCSFVEKLRTYRGGRDHAERLYVLDSVVIEPVSGTSRNAVLALAGRQFVFRPRSRSTLRRCHSWSPQTGRGYARVLALGARDHELKGRNAASRVVPGEQEAHSERSQAIRPAQRAASTRMGEPVDQLAGKQDPDALFGIEPSLRGTAVLDESSGTRKAMPAACHIPLP